jgi:hypothetical protein
MILRSSLRKCPSGIGLGSSVRRVLFSRLLGALVGCWHIYLVSRVKGPGLDHREANK